MAAGSRADQGADERIAVNRKTGPFVDRPIPLGAPVKSFFTFPMSSTGPMTPYRRFDSAKTQSMSGK
jgi:hypothetical protein